MKSLKKLFLVLFMLAAVNVSAQTVINGNQIYVSGASLSIQIPNASSTGTTLNKLAKLTGTGTAVIATTSDTSGILGVVSYGAGTTGSASIVQVGQVPCVFDGATTANDYVIESITVNGDCSDSGPVTPTVQNFGRVLSTNASGGTYQIVISNVNVGVSGGGNISGSGTLNVLPKFTSATGIGNSSVSDNGTVVSTTEGLALGSSPPTLTAGTAGFFAFGEGTAVTAASGVDPCYGDSTLHGIKCSYNNGTFTPLVLTQVYYCGATTGSTQNCAKTLELFPFIIFGDVLLNSASTQAITTLPFTSSSTYACYGSDLTTAAGTVSFPTYTSGAQVTIQETNGTTSDHLRYSCSGY
jgi:hypothetical protein